MINIAIFGFGVVGEGIACVLDKKRERIESLCRDSVNIKYILDLREFPESPYGDRVVHDISTILEDGEVSVVCEAMGGVKPAFEYSMGALKAGKSVITSNKELVAKHGDELLRTAEENGVSYLYEAAVGGGIPALRSMKTSLASDRIVAVTGILNGTTNYILTMMEKEKTSFEDALNQAQSLGYAEANPAADIHGFDAQRKIMILSAIATGKLVSEECVYTETMSKLTPEDIDAAHRLGGSVKLLGCMRSLGEKNAIYVCPFIVDGENPLANINDVYNGIWVEGETTGDVMYYGRGAGRYPTAGAMISDLCAVVSGASKTESPLRFEKASPEDTECFENLSFKYYIRLATGEGVEELCDRYLGSYTVLDSSPACVTEIVTSEIGEKEMRKILDEGLLGDTLSVIRLLK